MCSYLQAGETPLHTAVEGGYGMAAMNLLRAGSPLEATDILGMTALFRAVESFDIHMVDMLMSRGADLNTKNKVSHIFGTTLMCTA